MKQEKIGSINNNNNESSPSYLRSLFVIFILALIIFVYRNEGKKFNNEGIIEH